MILELPKEDVKFGKMGYVEDGILYVMRVNSFYNLMYEITYYIYGHNKCWYCGADCKRGKGDENDMRPRITLDHLIPISIGGPTIVNNLRPSCTKCNSKEKGDYTAEQYKEIKKMKKKLEEAPLYKKNRLNQEMYARMREMRNENSEKRKGIIPYLPSEYTAKKLEGYVHCLIPIDTKLSHNFNKQNEFYEKYKRIKFPVILSQNRYVLGGMDSILVAKKHGIPWKLDTIVLENVIVIEGGP